MISFEPIDAPLGAFVHGFDPDHTAQDEFRQALADGLLAHAVLVLRDAAAGPEVLLSSSRGSRLTKTAGTRQD